MTSAVIGNLFFFRYSIWSQKCIYNNYIKVKRVYKSVLDEVALALYDCRPTVLMQRIKRLSVVKNVLFAQSAKSLQKSKWGNTHEYVPRPNLP